MNVKELLQGPLLDPPIAVIVTNLHHLRHHHHDERKRRSRRTTLTITSPVCDYILLSGYYNHSESPWNWRKC
jgi:hypothetical protein